MATTDGTRESIVSVKASDEYHRFYCSPCDRDGKSNGASAYCLQCEEYFCPHCHKEHDRMAKLQDHTVLDENHANFGDPPDVRPAPVLTEPCETHVRQLINTFCVTHDQLACGVCVSVQHRYDFY